MLLAVTALPRLTAAEGGPPMITDDTATPGDGNWEINLAWTLERSGSSTVQEIPLVDVNYGVGDRIQLKFEVPWIVAREASAGTRSGLGNSSAGVKWRFRDAGEASWRASVYPQLEFENPGSSSASRGLADEGGSFRLPFQFEREFGRTGVDLEAGRDFRARSEDEWFGGIAIGRDVAVALGLVVELAWRAAPDFGQAAITLNTGARVAIAERGALLLSAGRTVHDGFEDAEATIGYLGWQFLF